MSVEKKTTTHIEYNEINKNEQVIKRYLSISERMKKSDRLLPYLNLNLRNNFNTLEEPIEKVATTIYLLRPLLWNFMPKDSIKKKSVGKKGDKINDGRIIRLSPM